MSDNRKHFLNPDLQAPNVREVDADPAVIAGLAEVAAKLTNLNRMEGYVDIGGGVKLYATYPEKWTSDIMWISQADRAGYDWFEDIFTRLNIAANVADCIDFDQRIVMYSGFFVTRKICSGVNWHHDWVDANNDAFTFLGPVSENCEDFGLAYQNFRGQDCRYDYRAGKGLVFGDHFLHSTHPGRTPETTVLLSFTFGTDLMENWDKISQTAASQGMFYCQPDGTFVTREAPAAAPY